MRKLAAALILLMAAAPSQTLAEDLPDPIPEESAGAVEIVDGDTLVLEDGREVRLVGIQAPKLPLGRAGFEAQPLAEEAKAALADLALGQRLALAYGGRRLDRHGRQLAHLYRDDGLWLQGRLLELGLARVYSFADNRALVPRMLALEAEARAAGRGIWALPFYAPREAEPPEALEPYLESFQLVEGRVQEVAVVRGRAFLNFGADWRSDFTVSLAPAVRRFFEKEGADPLSYKGRRIRIRGWLGRYNGPSIQATHPEQIELLKP